MNRPWNSRLILKFFLSYLAVIVLLFAGFFLYAGSVLRDLYKTDLGTTLVQEARLLAQLLPTDMEGPQLDAVVTNQARPLGVRITVIAPDGKVLGDSDEPSVKMENHAFRPEVVEALAQGTGAAIRHSTTVGYDMLYRALFQNEGSNRRIIRVAIPLRDIDKVTGALRRTLLLAVFLVSALGLVCAYGFSRRIGRRVGRVLEFSQEVAEGRFPQNFFPRKRPDELSLLEQKLNEMSLRIRAAFSRAIAEKEKVDSILRCMVEGLVVVDPKSRLLLINDQAQKMFKLPASQDLTGKSLIEIVRHPQVRAITQEITTYDFSAGQYTKEIELEGDRSFLVNAVSLTDGQQKALGFIFVFHDITDLKRLETVRADFVANVSHELRTPLTAIRGYVETLLSTPPADPKDASQFLEIIQRHTERLGRLTEDLLTLSDLESGRARMEHRSVEVGNLIQGVLEVFMDQAAKKNLTLTRVIEPGLFPLLGDPDRLQQLLINLIDNAVKFTPVGGGVTITANKAGALEILGSMVELAVSDTGPGIPEKDLPRLTERFYRVDKARSRELGGTGLGLAIVKHIVQAHGGQLKIDSVVQKGTTLRVILPTVKPSPDSKGILFLCTGNSCRSQMAEGFARHFARRGDVVYSAGAHPKGIHPLAIQVMKEIGIDISGQRSKGLEEVPVEKVDLLITLCGEAAENCPALPAKIPRAHWPLRDPAQARGSQEEILKVFREVRDEICHRVDALLAKENGSPQEAQLTGQSHHYANIR
jgi:two-component system phosphate regulon sensor histidine kinase PhoR